MGKFSMTFFANNLSFMNLIVFYVASRGYMSIESTWYVLQNEIIFFFQMLSHIYFKIKVVYNPLLDKYINGGIKYPGSNRNLHCEIINIFLRRYLWNGIKWISFVIEIYVIFQYRYINWSIIISFDSPRTCVGIMI